MPRTVGTITASTTHAVGGTNAVRDPIPLMMAPSDKDTDRNTIRPNIIPLACFKLEDLTFEFDSSFVMPGVRESMKEFKKLLDDHPGSPASVFGHADPVGNDDYNKALSGRRAQAVYGLLTRRTDLWEDLHKQAEGSKAWGLKSVQITLDSLGFPPGRTDGVMDAPTRQAVKDFQKKNELNDDGDPGPNTRKKLYEKYMDFLCVDDKAKPFSLKATDFLGKGADKDLKGDCQGCGEFNPVLMFSKSENDAFTAAKDKTERNAENAPNRRVMILLFRAGSKIDAAKWPCPRVKEGPAACRKRFWSDAETRRQFQESRREFKDTGDTFQCRFYQRLTDNSPCDRLIAPATKPIVEILNAAGSVTKFVEFGLWDNAFPFTAETVPTGTFPAPLNSATSEADNFVGADSRRFFIRVTDPGKRGAGSVDVDWRTNVRLSATVSTDVDAPSVQTLRLLEKPAGSGIFTSAAVMLVTGTIDRDQPTTSGIPGDTALRGRNQDNHRTREASMNGAVIVEYPPGSGTTTATSVFDRSADPRRRVPIQIFVLRVAAGGAGNIPTAAGSPIFRRDIRIIKENYERIGVRAETVVAPGTPAADIVTDGVDSIVLVGPPAGVANPNNVSDADEERYGAAHPALPDTVRCFFVRRLGSGNGGEAIIEVDFPTRAAKGAVFTIQATGPYAAAHEIGHILTNKSNAAGAIVPGHFAPPPTPAGNRFRNFNNQMKAEFLRAEDVGGAKRLWDVVDADGLNQFTAIRGSHFTRAF